MNPVFHYILLTFFLIFNKSTKEKVPFNLNKPEIKIELSKELKEISGLSWYNNNQLATIQDEAGVLYLLNASTGVLIKKLRFSPPGDFEGIETVGDNFFALASSGTLFQFENQLPTNTKRIPTKLTWKNDTEGLAYDKLNNRLLIVCKEQPGTAKNDIKKGKAVYSFNLVDKKLSAMPLFIVKKSELKKYVELEKFKPSAIAIDPLTDDIYLLSSVDQLLVVLDNSFEIKSVSKLKKHLYAQPEGICFSPDGDLYISNEGKNDKANIYHLLRQQ